MNTESMHPSLRKAYRRRPFKGGSMLDYAHAQNVVDVWEDQWDKDFSKALHETSREMKRCGIRMHNAESLRKSRKERSLNFACWKVQESNPFVPSSLSF